ncbi:hypothetical protein [uncultured Paludibaculum sp.]|uniref:hypothetical protein n=1 Tax=uncultured Paludibaculum sp. TaxID=1765020 RepID=UPI002AAB0B44|nr:hypothetical protein [uncultured Paludibaculum sp.]
MIRFQLLLVLLGLSSIVVPAQTGKADPVRKLTDEEKVELIRGLTAEYATVKAYLPRSKKAVPFPSNGQYDKKEWMEIGDEYGPVARVGELVQVTKIDFDSDKLILQINNGLNIKGKWYERIEGGVGGGQSTVPMSRNQSRSAGTTIAVIFPGHMPAVKPADIKTMLAPVLDFEKHSATESYFDTLPPEIQEAIKAKRAEIGMNRDQVKLAMGQPRDRIRETKDGLESEDWIYGYPPGKITFVTFANGKVTKVKDSYAGLGGATAAQPKPQQ